MKIKMLTGLSGPEYSLAPGDEREFGDEEGQRLIDAGFAERAADPKKAAAAAKAEKKG